MMYAFICLSYIDIYCYLRILVCFMLTSRIVTSTERQSLYFHSCLFVCLHVAKITVIRMNGFS